MPSPTSRWPSSLCSARQRRRPIGRSRRSGGTRKLSRRLSRKASKRSWRSKPRTSRTKRGYVAARGCRALVVAQIKELYAKIDELKAVISRGSGWTDEQLEKKQNLKDSIAAGNACLDAKLRQNEELREELAKLQQNESDARAQLDAKHAKIDELNAQADAKRDEAARELKVHTTRAHARR